MMRVNRRAICQHVKGALVTEVVTPYHLPHLEVEYLCEEGGFLCIAKSRMHLPELAHQSLVNDIMNRRTRMSVIGMPDGTGHRVGDLDSPACDGQRRLPWKHSRGYVLLVRRPDGQSRLIPGSHEYLRAVGLDILRDIRPIDRVHSIVQIGILVCNDPTLPEEHDLESRHLPMPGYKEDWDIVLREDLRLTPYPTR